MGVGFVTRRAGTLVKDISGAEVTLDFSSVTYDGSEHAPVIQSVRIGETELRDMIDYYAVITRQQNAGDYNIIINGIGEYGGIKQVPWRITKAQGHIRVEPAQVTIQGTAGTTATVNIIYEGDGDITISESQYVTSKILTYSNVFSENSWEQIAAACAAGEVPESWKIGDTKPFNVSGVDEGEYEAQIIGKNHDDLDPTDRMYGNSSYNGGTNKAAITLQFRKSLKNRYAMHSSNDNSVSWEKCTMRTEKMPQLLSSIDPELAAVLRIVTKKAPQAQKNATLVSTADKLFLLGPYEVFASPSYTVAKEGEQYEYYKSGNSTVKELLGGSAGSWWLRCPASDGADYFCFVYTNGISSSNGAVTTYGVAAGFCI